MNWEPLNTIISKSNNIILSTHINPDGDGLGSELGMYYYIKSLNKKCTIVNISKTPSFLKFIDPEDIIQTWDDNIHLEQFQDFDLAIIFDIGDYRRLGVISDCIKKHHIYSVSIDHHPYSDSFFDLALVDTAYPATGQMVWDFLQFNGKSNLSEVQSTALYAALITDTGSFRYSSTNSESHNMASNLLSCGTKPYKVYESIYERRSKEQINLLSKSINNLNFYYNGIICGSIITKKMQDDVGANPSHVEGFTDFFRSINKVEVAFCIIEQEKNIRMNFRSRGKYIINDIAGVFGGGGHKLAAGATVSNMTIVDIEERILKEIKRKI